MRDPKQPMRDPKQSVVTVDAGTLLVIVSALMLVPLLLTGFLSQ